jgi:cell division protein FtsZ
MSKKSHRDSERLGQELLGAGADQARELLEFERSSQLRASIKVVGVGGGGGNALNNMITSGLRGVEFVAANTDAQALHHNLAGIKLQLGTEITRGLGCGADPEKGRGSALEVRDRLLEVFDGADMVFVTAGLGGGTGTGAAPIIAEIAKESGALTVGVVTKPFGFEGKVRGRNAEAGLDELHRVVDTVITIPNQRLLALAGKNTAVRDAFRLADDVLFNAVRGISDLITIHGLINLDFADVRTIMNGMGVALMGTGKASGSERAAEAARAAISSPLLEDLSIDGAHGVLINITGGSDLTLYEVNEASTLIQEAAHEDANIIFGAVIDESMPEGEMRVTVIATGLDDTRMRRGRSDRDGDVVPERGNVTQLRRETPPLFERLPARERGERPERAPTPRAEPIERMEPRERLERLDRLERRERAERPLLEPLEIDPIDAKGDLMSPFEEDALEVPTFIRRGGQAEEDDENEPAFLRRSAD